MQLVDVERLMRGSERQGFLSRLRRDTRGNTLAMMAIALIPVSALAGSAVDMARLYVVKSRLQQACDAGVLAGRKFMTDTNSTALDATATLRAQEFFKNNFEDKWMKTSTRTFTPRKTADNQVSGTATVVVPMTVMKMFKAPDVTLEVSCEARYDVADTDVMFVLDTTGSMACPPSMNNNDCTTFVGSQGTTTYTRPTSNEDAVSGYLGTTAYAVPETTQAGGSRIAALRQAVKDFYATMAANIDPSTHVRYGFVTYTSTVNAGKAIYSKSPQYLWGANPGEEWEYDSRYVSRDWVKNDGGNNWSNTNPALTQSQCNAADANKPRNPSTPLTYNTLSEATQIDYYWNNSDSLADRCQQRTQTLGPYWIYTSSPDHTAFELSSYIAGTGTVTDPSRVSGASTKWDGCIEERNTEAGVTTFGAESRDLDPDGIPSSDIKTRWKPMWADVVYARNWDGPNNRITSTNNIESAGGLPDDGGAAPNFNRGSDELRKPGFYTCGKPVHRLSEMTAAQVAAYVDAVDFKPIGGTYHDVGMIWGTRMLSSKGIFASDTAAWPGRPEPNRVLVFLTDGAMSPNRFLYGMYGVEYYDRRVSGGDFADLTDYHNKRFLAVCAKARALKIDVWTVALGMSSTTELTSCASASSQALYTTSGTGLSDTFKKIAKQVAMLRVSK